MYSETFTEDFGLCAGEKEKKSMPPGMMGNSVNFYSETYRKSGADCRNGGDEEEFPLNPALQAETYQETRWIPLEFLKTCLNNPAGYDKLKLS